MGQVSRATAVALANRARGGDLKSLQNLLQALIDGQAYVEYAGTPASNLTPAGIGQFCLDTTNGTWFRSKGTANTDWVPLGDPDLDLSELTYLDIATLGTGAASKAVVLDANGEYKMPIVGHVETGRGRFEVFDDFGQEAIQLTGVGDGLWIAFAGSDADATVAVTITAPEGAINMGSGDGGTTNDGSVLSQILLAQGSLVSLGLTVFEARVSIDVITGCLVNVGLSDKLATDDEHALHTVKAGTIADGGLTVTNTAEFVFDTEATAATEWHAVSENAGTIVDAGVESGVGSGPTADTYQVLRIEIDATGDTRYYIDGALVDTETTAVATTALLIPYLSIDGEDGTPVNAVMTVDYIYFSGARPSSNA